MNPYSWHGMLTAKAGYGEKLATILLEASRLVSDAKGCRLYVISQDKNDLHSVWVTEIWDSQADHDVSLQVPAVRALIAQAMPIPDGMPQKGQELEVIGGKGVSG